MLFLDVQLVVLESDRVSVLSCTYSTRCPGYVSNLTGVKVGSLGHTHRHTVRGLQTAGISIKRQNSKQKSA